MALDAIQFARMTKQGDALELHGDPNAYGGLPVVAAVVRRVLDYDLVRPGRAAVRIATATDAIVELGADANKDWTLAT